MFFLIFALIQNNRLQLKLLNSSFIIEIRKIQSMKTQLIQHLREENVNQFSTNEVLKEEKSSRVLYYLPCYVRFKVRELVSIDIEGLKGNVSGTLLFTFYYGNLDRQIVDQFVGEGEKAILLQLTTQDSIQLKEQKGITYKEDEKAKMIDFVVRQEFTCNLEGDVFYTPFQIINLYLTITIQTVVLDPKKNNGKRIDIKFNCMTSQNVSLISHGEKTSLGNYSLATHFLQGRYRNNDKNPFDPISVIGSSNSNPPKKIYGQKKQKQKLDQTKHPINLQRLDGSNIQINSPTKVTVMDPNSPTKPSKKEDDSKIKNYQYVNFRIPLYKYPGANLVQIFIPLWILGFITLLIFFQDTTLSGRIASIATLTLAFIAFIPTINSQIPQTPYVKLIEILIYLQTLTTILCLIDSLNISFKKDPNYEFVWNEDGWFITALIVNLINVFSVFLLFVLHKLYWERAYKAPREQNIRDKVLIRKNWYHHECDHYFNEYIKSGKVKVI